MVEPISKLPVSGNKTIGNNAVAAIGMASVIHQMAIQTVDAKTPLAWSVKPSGLKKNTN